MERVDRVVEPPFARRRVQMTLLVIASAAALYVAMDAWRVGRPRVKTQLTAGQHGKAGAESARIEIDLNSADARELTLLPRVGPILAKRIVENRDRLGPFETVEDLGRVYGIGPHTLDQIRIYCVVGDLSAIAAMESDSLAVDHGDGEARLASGKRAD